MQERTAGGVLFALGFCLYWLTAYGGVRSPDGEVVFRTAESLARGGGWAVRPLEDWPRFGTAAGADGRRYSKFGPLPSIVLVPAVWVGIAWERAGWSGEEGRLPLSHYVGGGLRHIERGTRPVDWGPHRLRFAAAWVNPLLAALGVWVFFGLARRLTLNWRSAFLTALLYAFATPLWSTAGTFFSEPLAILLVLLTLERLTALDPGVGTGSRSGRSGAGVTAGLLAGAACAAHITAALLLPPLAAYAWMCGGRDTGHGRGGWRAGAAFGGGVLAVLLLLGAFNWMRFGSPFVGGRTTTADHFFGPWSAPFWSGLYGLLLSGGKGLLWFCPLAAVAAVAWAAFRRRHRLLADILAASVVLRVAFIAAYQDWHGGICLGPRYLLMLVPLMLLALPAWMEERKSALRRATLMVGGGLGVVQQAFFAMGEPFTYYHALKARFLAEGIMPSNTEVFTAWRWSPLWRLLEGRIGPWPLQGSSWNPYLLWGALALGVLALLLALARGAGGFNGETA